MSETELERLVVRIQGDSLQYQKTLDNAIKATQAFARQATSALAGFFTVKWLDSARRAFEQTQVSMGRLRVAIEANKGDVERTIKDYREFASAISAVTTASKGQTLNMLRQAETFGLHGDLAKAAVKNAISLAAVNGGEAESYLRVTAALAQGNVQLLRRLPGLRGIKDESQLLARAQEMLKTGFEQATIQGTTSSAALERLGRYLDFAKMKVGELVEAFIGPFIGSLEDVQDELDNVKNKNESTWNSAVSAVKRWGLIGQFEIKNFGQIWDWLAAKIAYLLVRIGNTYEHVMTERIPRLSAQLFAKTVNALGGNLEVPPEVEERREGMMEKMLREDAERLGNVLAGQLDEHLEKGLDTTRRDRKLTDKALQVGTGIGQAVGKGIGDLKIPQLEGILAGSAAAVSFLAQGRYEQLAGQKDTIQNKQLAALEAIKQNTSRGPIEVDSADFGEY